MLIAVFNQSTLSSNRQTCKLCMLSILFRSADILQTGYITHLRIFIMQGFSVGNHRTFSLQVFIL